VLVAGGAGFLGAAVVRRLVALGARVTAVDPLDPRCGGDRRRLAPVAGRIEWVETSIERFVAPGAGPPLGRWAAVFDCVGVADHRFGLAHPMADRRINCDAGLALLAAMGRDRAAGPLVAIGSRNQLGGGPPGAAGGRLAEDAPLAPRDLQAVHKTALEGYHRVLAPRWGVRSAFVRLAAVYGPGQRLSGPGPGFVGELLAAALARRELVVYGGLGRVKDLVVLDDAVEALVRLGAAAGPESVGVFHLGGGGCRVGALLAALDPLVGPLSVRLEPFPPEVAALDGGGVVLDCGRLERAVGPLPRTPLAIGLAATLAAARSDDTRPAAAPGSNGPPPARTRRPPERERVPIDAAGVTLSERSSP
jgi:nucleoside-diphosphate-sugar epimerase